MSDQSDLVKLDLEKKILGLIAEKIKSHSMSANQAGQIAKIILARFHNSNSLVEIQKILPQLANQFADLQEVLDPVVNEYNLRVKKAVDDKLDQLIEQGKIEQFQSLASKLLIG